jgi:hypothetical protein
MHYFVSVLILVFLNFSSILFSYGTNCNPPENIVVTGITSNQASVSWTSVMQQGDFLLRYNNQISGAVNLLNSNQPMVLLTNLQPSTTYTVSVLKICGTDSSAWSHPLSFTTKSTNIKDSVVRGAYLQMLTPRSVVIRWKSFYPENSRVRFGNTMEYGSIVDDLNTDLEHSVLLTGLTPGTKYYYTIGSTTKDKQGNEENYFTTAPLVGSESKVRIWAIGDFGTGNIKQLEVRDSYLRYTAGHPADLWIWLGDNAYSYGYDAQFTYKVFNPYKSILKSLPVFPSLGNHDYANLGYLDSATLGTNFPYFNIFNCPTQAECGGIASNTEKYYSYNYANIHFIVLDSYGASSKPGGAMYNWLAADLAANTARWTICYFHHPPYSSGTHNSDKEGESGDIRSYILPLIESYKVDLVLSGHAHDYERTFLMNGHYGKQATLTAAMKVDASGGDNPYYLKSAPDYKGTVYVVNGVGGQGGNVTTQGNWPHKAMYAYSKSHHGSMIIDVEKDTLSAVFLTSTDSILDQFKIIKSDIPLANSDIKPIYLNVFPNPANGEVRIRFEIQSNAATQLELYDMNHQKVWSWQEPAQSNVLNEKEIILQTRKMNLAKGTYMLKISSGNRTAQKKMVLM